nr:auxin-responsive protein IAA26-like [Ipomoea batatas]
MGFLEKKLELRVGPPDGIGVSKIAPRFRGRKDSSSSHLSLPIFPVLLQREGPQDPSQPGCSKGVDLNSSEKMAFSPPAVPNTSQKRTAPSPVVGWPPLRSFRKNLASSSSLKQIPESQNAVSNKFSSEKPMERRQQKGFFVKINMDGIPIGRKVDLSAYDSYEKLASAVNELFKGLLAAQTEGGNRNKEGGEKAITGLLDGSGEYTLVYEDTEGDTMLVGMMSIGTSSDKRRVLITFRWEAGEALT